MSAAMNLPTEMVEACILCGCGSSKTLLGCQDRLHRLTGSFGLVRCVDCGLLRLSPRPRLKDLAYYYPEEDYYSYLEPTSSVLTVKQRGRLGEVREAVRIAALRSLGYPVSYSSRWQSTIGPLAVRLLRNRALYGLSGRFPPYFPQGSVLDVGCGNGYYLSYLKLHGWQVAGIDINSRAAQVAKSSFGIDVFTGELMDAPFPPESFDFVHMSHVIEHLPEPIEALRQIDRLLKPGGIVYIETPNAESDGLKSAGSYWFPLDSPRHVYLFSPDTLRESLGRAGLRVTRAWTSFLKGRYSWEDTYQREESIGAFIADRPALRMARVPRALTGLAASRVKHFFDRFNGDVLHVWAEKMPRACLAEVHD